MGWVRLGFGQSVELLKCSVLRVDESDVGEAVDAAVDVVHLGWDVPSLDVPAAVVLERALLVERLAAVARKGLGSGVRAHVAIEFGLAQEP